MIRPLPEFHVFEGENSTVGMVGSWAWGKVNDLLQNSCDYILMPSQDSNKQKSIQSEIGAINCFITRKPLFQYNFLLNIYPIKYNSKKS